jgi:hypothetical protein
MNSAKVSAHYLVSKEGTIKHMLEDRYTAWHAGVVNDVRFSNNNSIGIEVHYTPEESRNIPLAIEALTNIVRSYKVSNPNLLVAMHRTVAVPKGRKIDPSFFSDRDFSIWRDIALETLIQKRIPQGTQIYTAPSTTSPKADHISNSYATHGVFDKSAFVLCKRQDWSWYWLADGVGFVESRFIP